MTHDFSKSKFAEAIEELKAGTVVKFRPVGGSMKGRIESGQLVTIEPCTVEDVKKNDVVACNVKGKNYLHLVKRVQHGSVQIGNMHGKINGWTEVVYGKVVKIEDGDDNPSKATQA